MIVLHFIICLMVFISSSVMFFNASDVLFRYLLYAPDYPVPIRCLSKFIYAVFSVILCIDYAKTWYCLCILLNMFTFFCILIYFMRLFILFHCAAYLWLVLFNIFSFSLYWLCKTPIMFMHIIEQVYVVLCTYLLNAHVYPVSMCCLSLFSYA
jgi:hypothetical protein